MTHDSAEDELPPDLAALVAQLIDPGEQVAAPDDFLPWMPERHVGSRGWSPLRQRLFVAELARHGNVRRAAARIGKSARSAYQLRDKPGAEHFAVAWDQAALLGLDRTRDRIAPQLLAGDMRAAFATLNAQARAPRHALGPAYDEIRDRLDRYELTLRRRELDLIAREHGGDPHHDAMRSREAHAIYVRAVAAADRAERQRAANAFERARRNPAPARRPEPRIRGL